MRISNYNMISQLYSNTTTKKSTTAAGTGYASFRDEISLSTVGKDMQIAKNALATTPDVREARIAELKAQYANGTYEVDSEDFATKLMESYAAKNVF